MRWAEASCWYHNQSRFHRTPVFLTLYDYALWKIRRMKRVAMFSPRHGSQIITPATSAIIPSLNRTGSGLLPAYYVLSIYLDRQVGGGTVVSSTRTMVYTPNVFGSHYAVSAPIHLSSLLLMYECNEKNPVPLDSLVGVWYVRWLPTVYAINKKKSTGTA